MPKAEPRKKPLLFLCGCFFTGALVVASVTALERSFHELPMELGQLWLPLIFGGIIGVLFGRSDLRMRVMSHRLENSEKRFLQFYQKTPAMLHSMDREGSLLYVSQAWLDTLGYEREDVIGKDFFEFVVELIV